ncbi:hypothetical protein BgiBS90_019073, partial [Biomphalaria glabrata]
STVKSSTVKRFSSQKLYWTGRSPGPAICDATIWDVQTVDDGKRICIRRLGLYSYSQSQAYSICK